MGKTIRHEVLAFVLAAQNLLNSEAKKPGTLLDHETEKIADCVAELEQAILESNLYKSAADRKVSKSEGNGHGDGQSADGDGHSSDGDGHP